GVLWCARPYGRWILSRRRPRPRHHFWLLLPMPPSTPAVSSAADTAARDHRQLTPGWRTGVSKSYSDSTLVCAASAPHAAQASLIRSSPFATSMARRRISFWQEGERQGGGGGEGSGWRGWGLAGGVVAGGDRVRVCRIPKRGQAFILVRERTVSRAGKLDLFGPKRGNPGKHFPRRDIRPLFRP